MNLLNPSTDRRVDPIPPGLEVVRIVDRNKKEIEEPQVSSEI
jgi:hypothetical protein